MSEVTRIINEIRRGEALVSGDLLPLVYNELRGLAERKLARERPGQTLSATALVHEAFIRLVDSAEQQKWDTKAHFFGAAAEAMRRILIDRARKKKRLRHGGDRHRVDLDVATVVGPSAQAESVDLITLDAALTRFAKEYPQPAELVKLRYFAGLTMPQVAEAMGISLRTAHRDWAFAKARLHELLSLNAES